MRRTKEEAEVTRQEILDAALRLFSEQGYAATRLNDIAAAAGVTRGAIYHHFDSKAGLYQQLLESFAGLFDREVAAAIEEGGAFLEICRRVMIQPLAALEGDPRAAAFYELAQFHTVSEPELQGIHARQQQGADTMFEQIAGYFRMGMDNNDIRADQSPVELARAFVALQNGLIHLWLQRRRAFSLVETAGTAAEIFAAGLVHEAK